MDARCTLQLRLYVCWLRTLLCEDIKRRVCRLCHDDATTHPLHRTTRGCVWYFPRRLHKPSSVITELSSLSTVCGYYVYARLSVKELHITNLIPDVIVPCFTTAVIVAVKRATFP
uniref:Uncharacterized protein n=1 Tax=Ixodes ricinus TaxID=34613 RepID=A0A6B0UKR1_IXORI